MSSATRVPEMAKGGGPAPDENAWEALRRFGSGRLVRESFARFRRGDGVSHARALGLQLALALVPLAIAFVGLSSTMQSSLGEMLRETVVSFVPEASQNTIREALVQGGGGGRDTLALVIGLAFSLVALCAAMGQIERGANRVYGIHRDRHGLHKYVQEVVMAVLAGIPIMLGMVLLIGAAQVGAAAAGLYGGDQDLLVLGGRIIGFVLVLTAVTIVLKRAPARAQPRLPWLAVGGVVVLTLWLVITAVFALYLDLSNHFTTVYGPLTGIMALLLWGELAAMALFFGVAFSAQLEAAHAGVRQGAIHPDDVAVALSTHTTSQGR